MATVYLECESVNKIKIFTTPGLAIFRQIAYLDDVRQRFQLVPSNTWGFCVVTRHTETTLGERLSSYIVYRPKTLTLDIDKQKQILWRGMTIEQAQVWHHLDPMGWRAIKLH